MATITSAAQKYGLEVYNCVSHVGVGFVPYHLISTGHPSIRGLFAAAPTAKLFPPGHRPPEDTEDTSDPLRPRPRKILWVYSRRLQTWSSRKRARALQILGGAVLDGGRAVGDSDDAIGRHHRSDSKAFCDSETLLDPDALYREDRNV